MNYNTKTILIRCKYLNGMLEKKNLQAEITLVGGTALAFNCQDARRSADIDAFLNRASSSEVNDLLDKALIDTNARLVATVPDFNDCKISKEFEYSNLIVKILDITELAISKLFSIRDKDLQDLVHYILPNIEDMDELRKMVKEYMTYYVGNLKSGELNLNSVKIEDYKLR